MTAPKTRVASALARGVGFDGMFAAVYVVSVLASELLLPERGALVPRALLLTGSVALPLIFGLAVRRPSVSLIGAAGLFVVTFLLGYIVPLASFIGEHDSASAFLAYSYRDRDVALATALDVATISAAMFWIGWCVTAVVGRPTIERPARWIGRNLQFVVAVYVVIGSALFALGVAAIGGPSALIAAQSDRLRAFSGVNYLLYGCQLLPLAWLVALNRRLSGPPADRRISAGFIFVGTLALAPTMFLGTKLILFFAAGTTAMLIDQLWRRVNVIAVIAFAGASLIGATAYDLIFRDYLVNRELVSVVLTDLSTADRAELVWEGAVGKQFMQLQLLTVTIDAHDTDLPAESGRTFLPVFTQLIPRRLWPGKPTTPAGLFAERLRPELVATGTTFPPSFVAELYWNGGTPLVVIGMLLLGGAARSVERWRTAAGRFGTLIGAMTVLMLPVLLRGDFSDTVTAWITFALPCIVAIALSTTSPRSERSPAPVVV